jgi:hypothetical protein
MRLTYPQYAAAKDAEATRQVTGMMFQDPPHDAYLRLPACAWHPQEEHASVRMSRMIHQFAKIGVHRDDNAALTHSPQQDISIAHTWISVANKSCVVAHLTQVISYCAADVEIHQEAHRTMTYAG